MKKLTAILVAVMMTVLMVTAGSAENTSTDLFAQLKGQVFEFSSGVGAWNTELTMGEKGTFTGNYHDSEMGETGEGYPDGTVYGCMFHGQFSDPQQVDDNTWTVKVSVELDEGQVPEAIEDGIRYVTAKPYGLEKAESVTIWLPETPVAGLPEAFMIWSHLQDFAPDAKELPYFAIWSEAEEAGFISGFVSGTQDETSAEQLPVYSYTGDDPIEGAIANALARDERAEMYKTEPGYVTIPCAIIFRTELTDDTHAKVYGDFWILNYVKRGNVLENISGGEYPGIIMLEKDGDQWKITETEVAGDGEDYTADIERFADGDRELADSFFAAADLDAEANQAIRTRFIKAYVEANGLDVTAYQDFGWDPVSLK